MAGYRQEASRPLDSEQYVHIHGDVSTFIALIFRQRVKNQTLISANLFELLNWNLQDQFFPVGSPYRMDFVRIGPCMCDLWAFKRAFTYAHLRSRTRAHTHAHITSYIFMIDKNVIIAFFSNLIFYHLCNQLNQAQYHTSIFHGIQSTTKEEFHGHDGQLRFLIIWIISTFLSVMPIRPWWLSPLRNKNHSHQKYSKVYHHHCQ